MKCPECNGVWQAPPNFASIKVCPFCGAELKSLAMMAKSNSGFVDEKDKNTEFNSEPTPDYDIPIYIEDPQITPIRKRLDEFYNDGLAIELIRCHKGNFIMGSPERELGRWLDEKQHRVTFSEDFFICRFPVTQLQYQAVMGVNPSFFVSRNCPVDRVNWHEANLFCEKLNEIIDGVGVDGYKFQLPTEAQWEYACRAGFNTSLNSGMNIMAEKGICFNLDFVAWYASNSGGGTHRVGEKKPNPWGIYDMHGNIWEWCQDWYLADYGSDSIDPKGPESGDFKICRGGACSFEPRFCRCASRLRLKPEGKFDTIGFRLAYSKS